MQNKDVSSKLQAHRETILSSNSNVLEGYFTRKSLFEKAGWVRKRNRTKIKWTFPPEPRRSRRDAGASRKGAISITAGVNRWTWFTWYGIFFSAILRLRFRFLVKDVQSGRAGEGEAEQVPGVHAEDHGEFVPINMLPEFRVADHERIARENGSGKDHHSPVATARNAREKYHETQIRHKRQAE